ncbi:chromosome segregation protein SMC [Candidatus Woesearchaeota archaeon]|mgnify:CR=1 FL=1|jgi:chromosome segregation protein|nr:chromosome segregation protein SMC [Candidatus Woesearchaeota archaeon]MBT5397078.1 chromosome segregation protein SMC [Candidatus Woesearchaeota archaeon]MBT6367376.1 chromosome segregation protein SMC [Candidatus Woesearchaeota archaeon]MBT7762478.1 chromosome segregation protein SMC [Candidatus Woesearchaeota archaeon]
MTKINRIHIHGFKSFAHKTEIPFSNEFNCILGPNGSGKSNIGDALCFVLGRLSAKSMRAEKAANLIFNGGKKKQPSQAGSVEIAFCNKNKVFPLEEKEIIINRTIKKSGSSVYRVNSKKKTRTEILDLLAHAKINPEGYNIILQGDITRFVTMPTTERRKVIEEISDVSLYEEKKHKAVLELNKVEDKLNNAAIILKERGTYLKELKKDRDQALRFKDLQGKIGSLKATHLHHQIQEKETVKQKFDTEVEKHQQKISNSEKKIDTLKETIQTIKDKTSSINKEIEQKGEKEQVKVHREIEDLKVNVTKDKARISTVKDEINKIKLRKDQFNEEIKDLKERSSSFSQKNKELKLALQKKSNEKKDVEQSIEQFKKKHKIESSQELDTEIEQKDTLIEKKQEEIQTIRQRQQELLREKDRIEYQLQTIDERIKKVREVEQQNKGQIKTLQNNKSNFKEATIKLNQCLDKDSSFASQVANARRNLVDVQEKHAKCNARSMTMQAGLANNKALQSILSNKNKFKGVHGTIAELGQVQKKFTGALEATAGSRMQNIVVDTDKTAAECITYLKSNKLGSASFIPLNKIKYREIATQDKAFLKQSGVHDFALNLVSFSPQYKKAFSYVFGNSLVVDDINVARNIGIGKVKMTTLDGNIAEASGVMRGGFMNRRSSLGFKEKDSLDELKKLDGEMAEFQNVISAVETKREANEQEISSLRTLRAELEASIITLEKTLHLDTGDLDATATAKKEFVESLKGIDNELQTVQSSVSSINKELASLKTSKQMLRSKVNELRNPRLLAQLSAFEDSKQQCREEIVRLENDIKNSTIQTEQLIGPEQEKIQEIMKQHDKEETSFIQESKTLAVTIAQKEKELVQKEKASKEFYSKYRQLFTEREKLNSQMNSNENEIEMMREKSRVSEREVNLMSLKNAEIKARLAGLNEEFAKYKDAELLKNKNVTELQQEINKFEVMLSQMSSVNMKALEVYEQVDVEFKKLIEKKDSLHTEKTDVMTMMNEIETKKKDHFMKTFDQANKNFQNIFGTLFKKGKAYLQLDNPNKPFDDGLSIKVKLSGNRFMDLKSLSGGEKTLTALSFIFAVQEYQPATFYILDEIDAALDKHNSEKLSKLIKNYSGNAQYIMISHNDSIISEADTLFGVSMNEGVSKITSLQI